MDKFFCCVFMDREEVEVHKHAKRTRPISRHLVPRVLVTLIQRQERAKRTSGIKYSAMTGFLDFQFYCACVRLHVSKGHMTNVSGRTLYPRGPCSHFCRWIRVTRTLGTRLIRWGPKHFHPYEERGVGWWAPWAPPLDPPLILTEQLELGQ